MKDGQRAMQLIIRCEKMCVKLQSCWMWCIFYRNVTQSEKRDKNHLILSQQKEDDLGVEFTAETPDVGEITNYHVKSLKRKQQLLGNQAETKRKRNCWWISKYIKFTIKKILSYISTNAKAYQKIIEIKIKTKYQKGEQYIFP
jgi:hypothetical protein